MNIAVLGLGIIGRAWAKNLIADRHAVRCWNRTPKDFPNFRTSILEAIDGAEVIFIVVTDPPAVQSVLDQIRSKLRPGVLVIQSSTISARWTRNFADQVRKAGADFLEAPFTGSALAAEKRQTVFYLGGESSIVERATPLLRSLSSVILHIGPLGSASSLKLAMNLNIAGIAQILCESLALCRASGIPDDVYFKALANNAAHTVLADLKEPKLRSGDYSPQFALRNMHKDLRLTLETADEMAVPLAAGRAIKGIYDRGMSAGWQDDDFIGLARLQERN